MRQRIGICLEEGRVGEGSGCWSKIATLVLTQYSGYTGCGVLNRTAVLARLELRLKVLLRHKTEASWIVFEPKPFARNSANSYRNKTKCWNHKPSTQQPTPTFWSMRSDKGSFTKCAITLPIRTRQREGLPKPKPSVLAFPRLSYRS